MTRKRCGDSSPCVYPPRLIPSADLAQEKMAANPANNINMKGISEDVQRALGALTSEQERLKAASGGEQGLKSSP